MKPLRHFLLLPLICLPTLVGCNRESIDFSLLHEELDELRERCERVERSAGELRKELRLVSEMQGKLNTELNQGRVARKQMEDEVKQTAVAFESYRMGYRDGIRKKAKGMSFSAMEMDGRRFIDVVIRELSDAEMTFQHRDGISRVESQKLPAEIKDLFVIDVSQAVVVASEAMSLKLVPVPAFLSLDMAEPTPTPFAAPVELPQAAPANTCPPCIAAPRGRTPTNYRSIGSSFQGSYYRHNRTSVGFQGTR